MPSTESRIVYMEPKDLPVADVNPKQHEIPSLKASLRRFGMVNPLIINERTKKLLAGHGRREALISLHEDWLKAGKPTKGEYAPPSRVKITGAKWLVPVVRGVEFSDDAEARAYLIADNRLNELGGWDTDMLLSELKALSEAGDESLAGVGWQPAELDKLLHETEVITTPEPGITTRVSESEYANAEIKQIVLFFDAVKFDEVVKQLDAVREGESLETHTDAIVWLLERYTPGASRIAKDGHEAKSGNGRSKKKV